MLSFECDYNVGAHPKILERLAETNLDPQTGYGEDRYSADAKAKIRTACGTPDADVWFVAGGTQTNQLVISTVLRPFEGVISANTGHVNGHEAGAIEYTGHKVLAMPNHDGKLDAGEVEAYLRDFYADTEGYPHMVFPGMVYVTHPTEYGTLYSKKELEDLRRVCTAYHIPLYLDGARLGYALACPGTDVTLRDIAALTDAFYVGGTKCGALIGEALVFPRNNAPAHFFTQMKQHGAVLAKGRLIGLQFDTLFTDGLYLAIAKNAIDRADEIRKALTENGYTLTIDSPTNQIFVTLENEAMNRLAENVRFTFWEKADENHSVIRIATSWATTEEDVEAFVKLIGMK